MTSIYIWQESKIKSTIIILLILAFGFPINADAQQHDFTHKNVYPTGLTIDYGTGRIAVQDDFFSREKYAGNLPCFKIGWTQFHGDRAFQFNLKYASSENIKNNQIAANVVLFSLAWDYLYPAGNFSLFKKDVYAYLGPYAEFFTYYNRIDFARDGVYLDFSFATLFSFGVQPMFILPLRKNLQMESAVKLNAFSVAIRMPEIMELGSDEESESRIKLLTPFSGLNSQVDFGIRYYLFDALSLKCRYEFQLLRISSWEYLLAANDCMILTATYHF